MPKILTKAKNIVVLILLLTVFPAMFVEGFLAYVYHFSDDEGLQLFKQTYNVFYKICMNSAYISLFLTYIASHFISKSQKLKLWLKWLFIAFIYFILFMILIFVIIFILGLSS